MRRSPVAAIAWALVVVLSGALAACCNSECIKTPPCCEKPKEAK